MSYFPFFMDIENKRIVIIGAGKIAYDKTEKMLLYGADVLLVAPHIEGCFENILHRIHYVSKEYETSDLEGCFAVIAATNSSFINQKISEDAKKMNLPVNVVDDKEKSTFIFPAIIKEDEVTIAISSQGISPSLVVYLKNEIKKILPANFREMIRFLKEERLYIAKKISDTKQRNFLYRWLFEWVWTEKNSYSHTEVIKKIQEVQKMRENNE